MTISSWLIFGFAYEMAINKTKPKLLVNTKRKKKQKGKINVHCSYTQKDK